MNFNFIIIAYLFFCCPAVLGQSLDNETSYEYEEDIFDFDWDGMFEVFNEDSNDTFETVFEMVPWINIATPNTTITQLTLINTTTTNFNSSSSSTSTTISFKTNIIYPTSTTTSTTSTTTTFTPYTISSSTTSTTTSTTSSYTTEEKFNKTQVGFFIIIIQIGFIYLFIFVHKSHNTCCVHSMIFKMFLFLFFFLFHKLLYIVFIIISKTLIKIKVILKLHNCHVN